jgi:hypothetical protein
MLFLLASCTRSNRFYNFGLIRPSPHNPWPARRLRTHTAAKESFAGELRKEELKNIMATFQRCPKEIDELKNELLCKFPEHKPLLDARVTVDMVFAYGKRDEKTDKLKSFAMVRNGNRVLGMARKISLKQRALGRGDAEIALDADWWKEATEPQRASLLDHELHHLGVSLTKSFAVNRDDLGRPKLYLRPHDYDFGWFAIIAKRHGSSAGEVQQAKTIADEHGQYFWPEVFPAK